MTEESQHYQTPQDAPPHEVHIPLPQCVQVPLPQFVREVSREAAWTVIKEHVAACPISRLVDRVNVLESRFYILIGAVIGSGALGGVTAGIVLKFFGVE